jgi:hypothetical protein
MRVMSNQTFITFKTIKETPRSKKTLTMEADLAMAQDSIPNFPYEQPHSNWSLFLVKKRCHYLTVRHL